MHPTAILQIHLNLVVDPNPCFRAGMHSHEFGTLRATSARGNRTPQGTREEGKVSIRVSLIRCDFAFFRKHSGVDPVRYARRNLPIPRSGLQQCNQQRNQTRGVARCHYWRACNRKSCTAPRPTGSNMQRLHSTCRYSINNTRGYAKPIKERKFISA